MSSPAPTRARRLVRRSDNTVIGGVCAGIADYLGIDPLVVRIAALIGAVLGLGTLVVAYLVLWAVLPLD